MSDVPLGLFLSGGLDSSAPRGADVAAWCASRSARSRWVCPRPTRTSSATRGWRRAPSASVHREVVVTPSEFFEALPRSDPARGRADRVHVERAALLRVASRRRGREGGADGRGRRRAVPRLSPLSDHALERSPRPGLRPVGAVEPAPDDRRISRTAAAPRLRRYAVRTFVGLPPGPAAVSSTRTSRCFRPRSSWTCSRTRICSRRAIPTRPRSIGYAAAPGGDLDRMSRADLQTYLVELLMKQDQMSMAASIESRVPFLDHEFVEQVAAMPGGLKLRGWQTKAVLREAIQDVVPPEILDPTQDGLSGSRGPLAARPFPAARRRSRARAARARAGTLRSRRAAPARPRRTGPAPPSTAIDCGSSSTSRSGSACSSTAKTPAGSWKSSGTPCA